MAITEEGGGGGIPATMLVGPANVGGGGMPYPFYMGGGGGNNGGFGDGGWWVVLLIIVIAALGGNWGGNNNGGGGGSPVIVNDGGVQRGFDQAAVMSGVGAIQSGISGLSTQLCGCCCDMQNTVNNGFFGVQQALCNGFNTAEMGANTRQIANMQNFNAVNTGIADLKYTVATENCADRTAAYQNTRDIIENCNRNNQAILDKLCQLELDGKNDKIADLERQLTMANLAASQTAQTVNIRNSIIDELRSCPIPSQPVYGSQPIFTCPNNNGCGCGGNF